MAICSVPNCGVPTYRGQDGSRGGPCMCRLHLQRHARGKPLDAPKRYSSSLEERLEEKIDKTGDCWLWNGIRDRYGYGRMYDPRIGKMMGAHRLTWEVANGPIPKGFVIDHLCHNPPCVNPKHLRVDLVLAISGGGKHCPTCTCGTVV